MIVLGQTSSNVKNVIQKLNIMFFFVVNLICYLSVIPDYVALLTVAQVFCIIDRYYDIDASQI